MVVVGSVSEPESTPAPVSQLLPVFTPAVQAQAEQPAAETLPAEGPAQEFPEEEIPDDMMVYEDLPGMYDEPGEDPQATAGGDMPQAQDSVAGDMPVAEPAAEEPQPAADAQPVAEAQPAPTQAPLLTVQAAESAVPGKLGITEDVYQGAKKQANYARETPINMRSGDAYTTYAGGVFTFRGDAFRQNAAFGTAPLNLKQMSVLWQTELGALRTGDSGTLYGMGWTGQRHCEVVGGSAGHDEPERGEKGRQGPEGGHRRRPGRQGILL